jgi:hypothetical protein
MQDTMKRIIDKCLSGRFFSMVLIISTYCALMIFCAILTYKGKLTSETFLSLFAGFTGLVTLITNAYFHKPKTETQDQQGGK